MTRSRKVTRPESQHKKSKRTLILLFLAGFVSGPIVFSLPQVREFLTRPLVVHHEDARGDAAYVLSGGDSIWERLRAASDLYHWRRVNKIILMSDQELSSYSFTEQQSWTAAEWHRRYLSWLGVPDTAVVVFTMKEDDPLFGTLAEAELVAQSLSDSVSQVVLVTSPQHTRRSFLAFRRTLPAHVSLQIYAATKIRYSSEFNRPLWLEYGKLLVYWLVVRP